MINCRDLDYDVVFSRPLMREVEESNAVPPARNSDPNWPAGPQVVHFRTKPVGKIACFAVHFSGKSTKSATAGAPGFQIRLLHCASRARIALANFSQR